MAHSKQSKAYVSSPTLTVKLSLYSLPHTSHCMEGPPLPRPFRFARFRTPSLGALPWGEATPEPGLLSWNVRPAFAEWSCSWVPFAHAASSRLSIATPQPALRRLPARAPASRGSVFSCAGCARAVGGRPVEQRLDDRADRRVGARVGGNACERLTVRIA